MRQTNNPPRPLRRRSRAKAPRLVEVGHERFEEAYVLLRHLRPELTRRDLGRAFGTNGWASRLGYHLVGIDVEGKLVALAGIRNHRTLARGPHLHVDDLVVDPAWRRRGIGRLLVEALESHARRHRLRAIHLDGFPEAVPFYTALGFVSMDCRPMKKRLPGSRARSR